MEYVVLVLKMEFDCVFSVCLSYNMSQNMYTHETNTLL